MHLYRFLVLLKFFFLITASIGFSQSFKGIGGKIEDDGRENIFVLQVDLPGKPALDSIFGLEEVCINIKHEYDDDLDIFLISPDGIAVELSTNNGYDGQNYTNTCFTNTAYRIIPDGKAPFSGKYRPEGFLSDFNKGGHGTGEWKLLIHDTYPKEKSGDLLSWNIRFGIRPAKAFSFSGSNLPIIHIHTNGVIIPDEPKIIADMEVLGAETEAENSDNISLNQFKTKIAIEVRGQSSRSFPKKHYGFITIDDLGKKIDSPLLGMPPSNEWTLNPSYGEKTLMRNVMSYWLYGQMGHYSVRTRYVELVLNGNYMGVYILTEKILRGKKRVDISKISNIDTLSENLSGGYIFKYDWLKAGKKTQLFSRYLSGKDSATVYFQYVYPNKKKATEDQNNYLKQYIDSFEIALKGKNFKNKKGISYLEFIDVASFIDYMIFTEISKNIDGYAKSVFFYKDKKSKDGKIHCGPVWDYDIAWGNVNFSGANIPEGWQWKYPGDNDRMLLFWWKRMMQDPAFVSQMKNRYHELRKEILNLKNINHFIDSTASYIEDARKRNFKLWPTIGVYTWPNPEPIPQTYEAEIGYLKSWIKKRLEWMDAQLK